MTLLNRFCSFLDRFDSQLVVNGARVKHELNQWIDQRVVLMRTEVGKMKLRYGANRTVTGRIGGDLKGLGDDDPQVETVPFEQFMERRANWLRDDDTNQPATSNSRKHKSTNQAQNKQKARSGGTSGSNRYVCKFPECGKSFPDDSQLAVHERIHLNIKPFSCAWANCAYSSEERSNVVKHIRTKHFRLPKTFKEQDRLNIVDNRDAEQFIQVDTELAQRRLE